MVVGVKDHPCNICTKPDYADCPWDCVWNNFVSKKYECWQDDCFLNYEGMCKGEFYDKCQLCTDLTEVNNETD